MAIGSEKSGGSVYLDTSSAQNALDKLNQKIDHYDDKLKDINLTQREMAGLQKDRAAAAEKAAKVQEQIEKGLGSTLQQQKRYVAELRNELIKLPEGSKKFAESLQKFSSANKVLKEMEARFKEVGKAQKEASMVGSFLGNLGANLVSNVVNTLKNGLSVVTEWSLQAGGVEKAFKELNNPGLLNQLRDATKGTVNDLELMKAAVRANNFKLPLEQLGTLLRFAQERARQTGESVSYLAESIVLGISRKSIPIMDNLGISATELNEEVKKTGDFAKASFNIVNRELEKSTVYTTQAADVWGRVKTFFQNAATSAVQYTLKVFEAKKSHDSLFDEAKKQVAGYQNSLAPLLEKYDELKGKTALNKDEQALLQGVIQRIAHIVPSAITEIDKYGNALDINKDKVAAFNKEQDKFLQVKERNAISSLENEAKTTAKSIELLVKSMKYSDDQYKKGIIDAETYGAIKQNRDERLVDLQDKLLAATDKLTNKYGKDLPAAVMEYVKAAQLAKYGIAQLTAATQAGADVSNNTIEYLTNQLKALNDSLSKLEIGSKEFLRVQKEIADVQKKLDAATGKKKNVKESQEVKDLKQLIEEIKKKRNELATYNLSAYAKEIEQAAQYYEKLRELAHGHAKQHIQILHLQHEEIRKINQKYREEELKKQAEADKKAKEQRDKNLQDALKERQGDPGKIAAKARAELQQRGANLIQQLQMRASRDFAAGQLAAQRKLLQAQRDQELEAKHLTEEQKKEIEEYYRQQERDTIVDYYTRLAADIVNIFSQISSLFGPNEEVLRQQEENELARLQRMNDKKRASDQKLLNNQLISRQEFNRKSKALDDQYRQQEAATKKKQWQRQKEADVRAAIISGGQAVLSGFSTKPFLPLGLAMGALATIKTIKEINAIKAVEAPEFEQGGMLQGPRHSNGGMPIVNPTTGRKVAEVEGGEAFLSRKTVQKNPGLVGALLRASMHNNGQLEPSWRDKPYRALDYAGIKQSIGLVRRYENGGVFTQTNTSSAGELSPTPVLVPEVSPRVEALLAALLTKMEEPWRGYVVYSDIEGAAGKLEQIKSDAIFK